MESAVSSGIGIVGYMALFAGVGIVFLFANLFVGRFLRPDNLHAEKTEIYECGEPTIGSSFVQFDLRFYVVALLFIIFDVEVAFFFPWATVFGKSMHLADARLPVVQTAEDGQVSLTPHAVGLYREMGIRNPEITTVVPPSLSEESSVKKAANAAEQSEAVIRTGAKQLAWITIVDIVAFFAVLMIGFAYVWKRGDLDWVRAVTRERATNAFRSRAGDALEEEAVSAA